MSDQRTKEALLCVLSQGPEKDVVLEPQARHWLRRLVEKHGTAICGKSEIAAASAPSSKNLHVLHGHCVACRAGLDSESHEDSTLAVLVMLEAGMCSLEQIHDDLCSQHKVKLEMAVAAIESDRELKRV